MEKRSRKLARLALVAGVVLGSGAASAVPLHQHYIVNPGGTHEIALGFCKNDPQTAFDNFHWNVHKGVPGTEAFTNPNNPVSIIATACPNP